MLVTMDAAVESQGTGAKIAAMVAAFATTPTVVLIRGIVADVWVGSRDVCDSLASP